MPDGVLVRPGQLIVRVHLARDGRHRHHHGLTAHAGRDRGRHGAGGAVIDTGKRGEQETKRRALDIESRAIAQEVASLTAKVATTPAPADIDEARRILAEKTARGVVIAQEIAAIDRSLVGAGAESRGFRTDILGDSGDISFHRFQVVVWTVVLAVVFVHSVWTRLAMPQFSETLLGLMGISAGTYLGFKIPEARA
jgi:hypothetical protein